MLTVFARSRITQDRAPLFSAHALLTWIAPNRFGATERNDIWIIALALADSALAPSQ
jgi:hypothetical protein